MTAEEIKSIRERYDAGDMDIEDVVPTLCEEVERLRKEMNQHGFGAGVKSMAHNCKAMLEVIRQNKWTLDEAGQWLDACINDDPEYKFPHSCMPDHAATKAKNENPMQDVDRPNGGN